jgi:hypothetical protein
LVLGDQMHDEDRRRVMELVDQFHPRLNIGETRADLVDGQVLSNRIR